MARLASGICWAWLVATAPTAATQDPPPDLRVLKAEIRRDVLTAMLPEMKTHREALLALEKKCAAAQDFAGAIRARDERLRVEADISAMEKELPRVTARASGATSSKMPERIELPLSQAALSGLQFYAGDGTLSGFDSAAASATWKLPGLPAGGYEVVLRSTGADATATLKESFHSLTATLKLPTANQPIEQNLGTLRVRDGAGTLSLTVSPPEKCQALRVYSLALVPSSR